jgi:hypothetical protein
MINTKLRGSFFINIKEPLQVTLYIENDTSCDSKFASDLILLKTLSEVNTEAFCACTCAREWRVSSLCLRSEAPFWWQGTSVRSLYSPNTTQHGWGFYRRLVGSERATAAIFSLSGKLTRVLSLPWGMWCAWCSVTLFSVFYAYITLAFFFVL